MKMSHHLCIIHDMLQFAHRDKTTLLLINDMWDSMIEKVEEEIYLHEKKNEDEPTSLYSMVHDILVSRWNKENSLRYYCIGRSLNLR